MGARFRLTVIASVSRRLNTGLLIGLLAFGVGPIPSPTFAQANLGQEIPTSSQQDLIDAEFNQERGQIVWVDRDAKLWVADVNRLTGAIVPSDGKGQLVDPDALRPSEVVSLTYNGPEWLPSADGVYIVYTKFLPNRARTLTNARLAIARQLSDGTWESRILQPEMARNAPYASNDASDPSPRITYVDPLYNHYWRDVDKPAGEEQIPGVPRTPKSVRFVNGARSVVFAAPALGVQQIFKYDLDTKALEQLTFDDGDKDVETVPWMWAAPEFNGNFVLMTVVNRNLLRFYRRLPVPGVGLAWLPFAQRDFPAGTTVWSPEPFVYQGQSYAFTGLSVPPDNFSSEIWFVSVNESRPFMRRLDDPTLPKARMDPEAFVTELGPFIYYNRFDPTKVPGKPLCPSCSEGVFRAHTGLPPPR
jgi:hypothetical protein